MPRINNSNVKDVKTLTLMSGMLLLVLCGGGGTRQVLLVQPPRQVAVERLSGRRHRPCRPLHCG
ncbi:MAG: hypothetical protein IPO17_01500 [Flavobacteriales bacterium]|nr:hypothetical protein [Flavobacteriales bacterium]